MSIYKCRRQPHKIFDPECLSCIDALHERHNRMFKYIKKAIEDAKISENYHRADEAIEVLKEIGKL